MGCPPPWKTPSGPLGLPLPLKTPLRHLATPPKNLEIPWNSLSLPETIPHKTPLIYNYNSIEKPLPDSEAPLKPFGFLWPPLNRLWVPPEMLLRFPETPWNTHEFSFWEFLQKKELFKEMQSAILYQSCPKIQNISEKWRSVPNWLFSCIALDLNWKCYS